MNIGSVSSGTMLAEDLIPSFLWELEHQKPMKREHRNLVRDIRGRMDADDYYTTEDADFDLESLFNALDAYAPPYFYFGAHPGNGSDYGFWLSETMQEDFDGLKVGDLADVPNGYRGEVLLVNDHGNMTLYVKTARTLLEVWAVV